MSPRKAFWFLFSQGDKSNTACVLQQFGKDKIGENHDVCIACWRSLGNTCASHVSCAPWLLPPLILHNSSSNSHIIIFFFISKKSTTTKQQTLLEHSYLINSFNSPPMDIQDLFILFRFHLTTNQHCMSTPTIGLAVPTITLVFS